MRMRLLWLGIFMLVIAQSGKVAAQVKVVLPEKYYAISVYNFSRHVKWPDSYNNQTFKIAVVGHRQVFNELSELTRNLKYGQQNYDITYFKNYSEVEGFHHIVFLSNSNSTRIQDIKSSVNDPHMMFVTERAGMESYGSAISFFISDAGRIEFELMDENMHEQNLAFSSQLKSMSKKKI